MIPSLHESDRPNPFCSRFIRPGGVEYIFTEGETAARLVARLRAAGWQGEIVGPHGSGKSALLAALVPEIRRAGKTPALVELHDRQRRLPIRLGQLSAPRRSGDSGECTSPTDRTSPLLVIDGYEQLGRWSRFRLERFRRRTGMGLLITSHRPMGFAPLRHTHSTAELTARIVERLLAARPDVRIRRAEIQDAWQRHNGNIREALFDLYDQYELCRRGDGNIVNSS